MAINAVKNAGTRLREAAKTYNVPYSTLQYRVRHDIDSGTCRRGRKPALAAVKENTMVDAIIEMKNMGFGLSRKEVINLIIVT